MMKQIMSFTSPQLKKLLLKLIMSKKLISIEEFYNQPRLYQCSNAEIKSDYKKLEVQHQYLTLRRRYDFNFKRKKFDVANLIKKEMNKLIRIRE